MSKENKLNINLKLLLKDRNISKIANELDISKQRLHDWAMCGVLPSFGKALDILKIADYFNLSFEELVFGAVEERKVTYRFYSKKGALVIVSILDREEK